jgi:hypothetical protein
MASRDQRVALLQREASLRNMRLSSSPGDLPSKTAWFWWEEDGFGVLSDWCSLTLRPCLFHPGSSYPSSQLEFTSSLGIVDIHRLSIVCKRSYGYI